MKPVIKFSFLLFLVLFFSCETKTTKKEEVGYCGTSLTKGYWLHESMPIEVKENCISCHDLKKTIIGPSFKDIGKKMYEKDALVSMLKNPTKFNDTNRSNTQHIKFDYINDSSLTEIAKWIDSVWYYSIYLD